jgi:hypothetical protein
VRQNDKTRLYGGFFHFWVAHSQLDAHTFPHYPSDEFQGDTMPLKKHSSIVTTCNAVFFTALLSQSAAAAESCIGSSDILLTNGTILTMDASDSTASSLRIRGDRIIAIGGTGE